jgi:hypothetical protein
MEHGFVHCVEERQNKVFNFQNSLIKDTLYQLTPPSDALRVHIGTAQFIEKHYSANLRPYYGQLR